MSLYPTLEDMKVAELVESQLEQDLQRQGYATPGSGWNANGQQNQVIEVGSNALSLYPSLGSYMGLELATIGSSNGSDASQKMIAPVSSQNAAGINKAEIKPGIRKVTLCKDGNGKVGVVLKEINKGLFVAVVYANTPAALGGLRFGDQILDIDGKTVAGWSDKKAADYIKKKCHADKIEVVIRDRPFERTITLNKDSIGTLGFQYKNGKITSLVKDSSAARNGVLIEHQLIEIDGRNVVGMKDKEISEVIKSAPRTTTLTIMPSVLYDHMVKSIGSSIIRKHMDHSVPEL